jgi:crossover junction endodeoxyribonuclease RuvC
MTEIVLALDLGTKCGFCVGDEHSQISGVWNLKQDRFSGGGMRFVRFRARLDEINKALPITQVVFEEVRRHRGTDAAHVYGGLMAVLTEWCEQNKLPYEGVPVGTIKKFWTGNGAANKEMMLEQCEEREISVVDDNEADAVALFHYATRAVENVIKMVPKARHASASIIGLGLAAMAASWAASNVGAVFDRLFITINPWMGA